ncbi:MAG: hypothetical protein M1470_07270 [Bacteroidetes bacterium]|nr:hypothetical protein [Bacteroidota bacterium]
MKRVALLVCVSLSFAGVVLAGDGSVLSAKGAGAFTSFASDRSAGMGNSGLALLGNGYLSRLNPATWSALSNVQFTATYAFSGVSSQDKIGGMSSYDANGNFGGGIFAMPLDRSLGFTLAAGFAPLTSHVYKISSSQPATSSIPASSFERNGDGGLGEGFVGASIAPARWLSVGAMFNYAFGRTESTDIVSFQDANYFSSYSDNSVYLRGPGGSVGIVLSDLNELTKLDFLSGLSVAGYFKTSYNLNGNYELRNFYVDGLDTTFSQSATGYIPPEYGFGIAKKFNDRLTAVLDVRTQALSKYQDTFTPAGSLKDALFLGGGIEYFQGREIGSLYQKRILRAGFYYQRTQFVLPTKSGQDKQVDELFVTAGVEFPLSFSSTVDVSAQYGFRGLSSDFLLQEKIFRLYVSVTMGEAWFVRPEGG